MLIDMLDFSVLTRDRLAPSNKLFEPSGLIH